MSRRATTAGQAFGAALLVASPAAFGAGEDVDIELLRPRFSQGAVPGLDAPLVGNPGTWRVGLFSQYERDPLLIYEDTGPLGAIVARRQWTELGASWDVSRPLTVRAQVPIAVQWDSGYADLAGDGAGFGDASLGARLALGEPGSASWRGAGGIRADVTLPTSSDGSWLGEGGPVLHVGVLGLVAAGPAELFVDVGARARKSVEAGANWTHGSQWTSAAALRLWAMPDEVAIYGAIVALGGSHAGESLAAAVESVGGLQVAVGEHVRLDLGAGAGLSEAVGTSSLRVLGGFTWLEAGPAPLVVAPPLPTYESPLVDETEALPEEEDLAEPDPDPEPVPEVLTWSDDQLARLAVDRIETRWPLEFGAGTAKLAPSAEAIVDRVAAILVGDGRLLHVVIEGHASPEGGTAANYELSLRRSVAVYEALVAAGVHPDRISVRGKGEVEPVADGTDPSRDRRVEFLIVRQRFPGDPTVAPAGAAVVPWTGEAATFPAPPSVEEAR